MRRLVAVMAAALLVAGSAAVAMAAPYEADDTPQAGWTCPAWTGTFGNYDPATNPSLKRVADKLGMSAADFAKEMQAGKSVAEVSKARNVDLQAVVDVLIAPQKEMMATRVKYGFLTQEQADVASKAMAETMKARLELKGFFGGMGPGHDGPRHDGPRRHDGRPGWLRWHDGWRDDGPRTCLRCRSA